MATFNGTAGNNLWVIIEPATVTIDGRGGTDTIEFGTSLRSSYDIYVTEDGVVHVDGVGAAPAVDDVGAGLDDDPQVVACVAVECGHAGSVSWEC